MNSQWKYVFGLGSLLLIALIIRGGVLFISPETFLADPDQYRALAVNLREQAVFGTGQVPTAFRPPLYPAVLAGMYCLAELSETVGKDETRKSFWLTPVGATALLHWILGIATVFLVWRLALISGLSTPFAWLAGVLVAIDPILLQQSRLVMTETMATFFAVLILFYLMKLDKVAEKRSLAYGTLGLGILLGIATLCRPAYLAFAGLIFLSLLFFSTMRFRVQSILFLLGLAMILVPWSFRNQRQMTRPIFTTTHDGYTLLLANNRFLFDHYRKQNPWDGIWDAESFHQWWEQEQATALSDRQIPSNTPQAELLRNELARDEAWRTIRERPGDFVKAIAIRIGNLWQCLPYRLDANESNKKMIARWTVGGFYVMELLFALFGCLIWRKRAKTDSNCEVPQLLWWSMLLCLSVQIPHLIYWTNMRMRAPLLVVIAILVAGGLSTFFRSRIKR